LPAAREDDRAGMLRRYQVRHPRSPTSLWVRRVLGLAGTGAVLAIGGVSASMVLSATEDEVDARGPSEQAASGEQAAKPGKPDKPRLSSRQRELQRRATEEVRRAGYKPVDLDDLRIHHDQVLRVLIGKPVGTTPKGRRAFFFVRGGYIGQDAISPSLKLRPGRQLKREITLVYTLFEPTDRQCCPTGGETRVHFRWTGESLEPQEEIPPDYERLPPAFAET
jgi:LppP/LprE lipoprotein